MNTESNSSGEKHTEKLLIHLAKKQLFYSRLTAVLLSIVTVVVLISAVFLLPKSIRILSNTESITAEFKDQDIGQLIEDIDQVTRTSQDGIQQAVDRLNQVDLESLNNAIQNLNSVVKPIAKFFGQQ